MRTRRPDALLYEEEGSQLTSLASALSVSLVASAERPRQRRTREGDDPCLFLSARNRPVTICALQRGQHSTPVVWYCTQ